jgi:hypothetical protein
MTRAADVSGLTIEPFGQFARVVDPTVYKPVPSTWWLGLSDVIGSTAAIEAGRYKAVNMAGAAVISAMMNALDQAEFPFVFGGDGASFVVPPANASTARATLADTSRWVADDLGLALRVALVPVAAIREAGLDLRVARFTPTPAVSYALFSGGGLAWAETRMKAGDFAVEQAPAGARPDLSGLSCRWQPIPSRRGVILSLIVRPDAGAAPGAFAASVRMLLDLVREADIREGHPVPEAGPPLGWPPEGLTLEVLASRGHGSAALRRLRLLPHTLLAYIIFKSGIRVGGFDPGHYLRQNTINTDYRKFDDGLRMTIDCRSDLADRIERLLSAARTDGVLRFGTHRQEAAQMTCIVPSVTTDDHFHFVDGAGGGYAMAASKLA